MLSLKPINPDFIIDFPEIEHPKPFQCAIEIHPVQASNEVDHVNNIEFLRWIDLGAQMHCDIAGWTRDRLLNQNMMWFVARHEIDYRSEATLQDELRLTTWVEDVRRVKSWRSTYIHAINDDNRLVCHCRTLWVLVDLHTRRPISVPQDMADALHPLSSPRITTT